MGVGAGRMMWMDRTAGRASTYVRALLIAGAALGSILAPPLDAAAQQRGEAPGFYAIENARIVTVSGPVIERGTIVVRNGVIVDVGTAVTAPAGAWAIDGTGLTVYPGLIDALSDVGIGPTRGRGGGPGGGPRTRPRGGGPGGDGEDGYSRGPEDRPATFTWVKAADTLEVSDAFGAWRSVGFAAAVTAPRHGFFPGQAALINLGEGRAGGAIVATPVALRMNLRGGPGHRGYPVSLMGTFAYIKQLFADARHYADAWAVYERNPRGLERPAYDRALEPLARVLAGELPLLFPADTRAEIQRALVTSEEIGARPVVYGAHEGYRAADLLRGRDVPVLVSLAWPAEGPDTDPEAEPTLDQLRHRLLAPTTPRALHAAGIPFALHADTLAPREVLAAVRQAVEAGLPHDEAVRALTLAPADIFGAADRVGSLERGKIANLVVTDGDLFADGTEIRWTFVDGRRYEPERERDRGPRMAGANGMGAGGTRGERGGGETGERPSAAELRSRIGPSFRGPYRDDPVTLIRNATVLTITDGTIEGGDVLIRDGRIAAVGRELDAPDGARVVDADGRWVMPGVIDAHSHIAGGGNEGSISVSSMVGIEDQIDPDDIGIYRALAGGVTTANILHGSANPIGGKNAVLKMRWGADAPELLFDGAPQGIKFALGENPKRDRDPDRYPATRMGVMDVIRSAFVDARAYVQDWERYEAARERGERAIPPKRDLKLEALAEILRGERRVHAHSYRADEILQLMRLAEEFGFRIATFQHVLEGYKVADELAEHGAGASTFSDWWAYKVEAYDAIPYNAAIMTERGVLVSINSDSGEEMRHLNEEAAKAIHWGGLSETQALSLITINPARQLGIDDRVGSIEVGKDADIVIYDRHPLDNYSVVQQTYVDGKLYFDREADLERRRAIQEEREALMEGRDEGTRPITDGAEVER